MTRMPLHLLVHPDDLAIVQLDSGAEPAWDWRRGPLASLTWTSSECSVITLADGVPSGLKQEGPFRVLEVAGPLDFAMFGVLREIIDPLAEAGHMVLSLSTFETEWVLVRAAAVDDVVAVLRKAGLIVTPTVLWSGDAT